MYAGASAQRLLRGGGQRTASLLVKADVAGASCFTSNLPPLAASRGALVVRGGRRALLVGPLLSSLFVCRFSLDRMAGPGRIAFALVIRPFCPPAPASPFFFSRRCSTCACGDGLFGSPSPGVLRSSSSSRFSFARGDAVRLVVHVLPEVAYVFGGAGASPFLSTRGALLSSIMSTPC